MKIEGKAKAVGIFLGESDQWHGEALETAIVERAHKEGLAGATAFHGVTGFGANSVIHRPNIFKLSQDRPVYILIVDTIERIDPFLQILDEMVQEGMVITWEVNVEKYVHAPKT
jgi:hypothetical protein